MSERVSKATALRAFHALFDEPDNRPAVCDLRAFIEQQPDELTGHHAIRFTGDGRYIDEWKSIAENFLPFVHNYVRQMWVQDIQHWRNVDVAIVVKDMLAVAISDFDARYERKK